MTLDKLFFAFMALAGAVSGAVATLYPQTQDLAIKPYFWVLIAVLAFDGGLHLYRRSHPGPVLSMGARLLGFVIGVVLLVAIPTLAGVPVRFF